MVDDCVLFCDRSDISCLVPVCSQFFCEALLPDFRKFRLKSPNIILQANNAVHSNIPT